MRTYIFSIIVLFIVYLTPAHAFQKDKDHFVVVLDAGHGGHDPGNLGSGYKEKDIALKIALEVGKELSKHKDIKVIYTRKTDVFLELHERAAIANKADADLFVSIHCNSHHSSAHGTETFVLGAANTQRNFEIAKKENEVIFLEANYETHYEGFNPNSPESSIGLGVIQEVYTENSIKLARLIEDNFSGKLSRKSRGVKQASLWVLHNTYMPSVLIEVGFLTYKPEGKFLNSSGGQTSMAIGIRDAILSYKDELSLNVGESIFSDKLPDKQPPIENETIPDTKEVFPNIVFKVQIAASSRQLEPKPYNFKGLDNISRKKEDGLYKYYYGYTSDYNEVQRLQNEAKAKGYTTCFIVAYRDGNKIDVSEAIKSTSN
jgi:N-acetylmuramoyl-L-alanine amidase